MPVNSFVDRPLSWIPRENALEKRPFYLSLAAALEEDIIAGKLTPGSRLPPQRELADFLDIDFTTVTRAYNVCRGKGLVYGVTGRGTFVAPFRAEEGGTVDCAVVQGFPETGADEIAEAARDMLARPESARIFSYRDRDGSPRACEAGLKWLETCGVKARRAAVFPGAQGAVSSALLSLFRPGDAVAVDEYTYANFISLSHLAHLRLVPVPADRHGMRPDLLCEATEKASVKGLFLMPRQANPTGITLPEKRKKEISETVLGKNLLLIEDDSRLLPPGRGEKTLFSLAPENTVYIAGSTRNIAPGLRATFAAFPEKHSPGMLDALHHLTIKAGILDAEILAELVLSGRAEKILVKKAKKAREANAIFESVFPKAPKASPTALFRTLPLPGTSGYGRKIEAELGSAGVCVCHSDRFSVKRGRTDSFLRISVSSETSSAQLRKGLETVSAYIRAV